MGADFAKIQCKLLPLTKWIVVNRLASTTLNIVETNERKVKDKMKNEATVGFVHPFQQISMTWRTAALQGGVLTA